MYASVNLNQSWFIINMPRGQIQMQFESKYKISIQEKKLENVVGNMAAICILTLAVPQDIPSPLY